VTLSFQDTLHRQMAQVIKWSNYASILVTMVFEVTSVYYKAEGIVPHDILLNVSQHVGVDRSQSWAMSCHGIFDSPRRDRANVPIQIFPQQRIHRSLIRRPKRPCNKPSTSMYISGYVAFNHYIVRWKSIELKPHLSLRLEAHLLAAPIQRFEGNHDIFE
jgi:hypothetical protein